MSGWWFEKGVSGNLKCVSPKDIFSRESEGVLALEAIKKRLQSCCS